jgi:transcription elongation factor SPT5
VDEDEDENEDDEDDEIRDNFIADTHPDDVADLPEGGETDDRRHRELDRRREMEASLDAEKQAEILRQRYALKGRAGRGAAGDSGVVPKRLLLPSVDDPSIWAVRCKDGKEREAVFSIMKRIEERMGTKDELAITSVFERGGTHSTMKGFIYVEAHRQADIMAAMDGVMNVYPRTKMMLVEIKEMPDLLRVTKSPSLEPGAYVRLKRPPKYAGDLAQVIDVTDTGLELRVRYVPRLDYGLNDDIGAPGDFGSKRKRPTTGPRPPQRLFSEVEARKRHAKHLSGRPETKTWQYLGDEYINGYCEKEVKIQTLVTKDVNPTLEEVTRFASGAEDGTENLDLNALAASLKASTANASYLPGDIIEVYEGEQKGVEGKALSVQGDIVTMFVSEGDLKGQTIEVPVKGLRKRFREGDHVKVIGGSRYRDEVGMVVKITEDRVTLLTDQSNTEVTVFSKDLREASDSGGGGSLGQFDLWDLVQLDPSTVACITKVDRESLVVLDQNSQTRTVMPSQISNKLEARRHAVATDRNGAEIRAEDVVKEYGGEGKQGKIMHIHRAYLFCRSSDMGENGGVFVARSTNVTSISAKGGRAAGNSSIDLSSMNPATKRNPGGTGDMPPPAKSFGRDRSIGQTVIIRKGPYKGMLGIVKETTDTNARVELHTKNKTVNVPKDGLTFKDKITGNTIDPNSRGGFGGSSGGRGGFTPRGGRGGATPGTWDGGRTPMPPGSGGVERTPAWGTSRSKLSCTLRTIPN